MKINIKKTKLNKNICKINSKKNDEKINNNECTIYKNIYGIEKGVPELTLNDFKYDKNNKKVFINNKYFNEGKGFIIFYAPWCQHCVKLSDMIIDLALSNMNFFPIGAVNIENTKDKNDYLAQYSGIKDIPTIKYISNDLSLNNYKFDYNVDNLIFYINTNG
jgi:thiol-disulfide isomerase/thioredoxin